MRMVALQVLLLGGCSFAFVHGPPPRREPLEDPRCTRAPFAPVADGILTVFSVIGLVSAQLDLDDTPQDDDVLGRTFVKGIRNTLVVTTLVSAIAATYGFVQLSRCQRAYREYWSSAPP